MSFVIAVGMICTLRSSPCTPGISPHWYGFAVTDDIVQVGDGALEFPAIDGLGGFACILEGDTEVGASSAGGFGWLKLGGCVADL